ncbi:helix-turn-helix domain-containing protein [Clostridium botulinum]|uniref:helix-turn-helix domain-containing protein n=1 Tax=Clostridium botulinum TaxID=1491 RepID=UPI000A172740|nr:helix-turn-helix transcriptional regulator [Clostridium botulinum]OSA69854.1 hypothetical protein B2H90_00655 [Clostridium botulinum]OSA82676.1 hypothetical protein B2H84_07655 [Clostridium botulinum]
MNIGSRIRDIRLLKNLTITALAESVGTTRPYLSDIERGVKKPSFDMLEKICQALDVTLEDFLSVQAEPIALTTELKELLESAKDLSPSQLEALKVVAKSYKEGR